LSDEKKKDIIASKILLTQLVFQLIIWPISLKF
jgi:hypothetical protein